MIYEGFILERNQDLAEVCLPAGKKNGYVFLPERIMELVRPGMRILFQGQDVIDPTGLDVMTGDQS